MTKWKQRLDEQLGTDQKFSDELAEQIEKKAKKSLFDWRYPVTLVAFTVVAMLLILVNVGTMTPPENSATPFELLVEQAEVERFYISTRKSEAHQFLVRDSSSYLSVHEFEGRSDTKEMHKFLQQMKATEAEQYRLPYYFTDVVVVMTNGEQLLLKIGHYKSWLIAQDVQSKRYYTIEGQAAVEFLSWKESLEMPNVLFWFFVFIVALVTLSNGLYKLFGIPKPPKKKFRWRDFLVYFSIFFITTEGVSYLLSQEIVMYKPVIYGIVVGYQVIALYFEWRKNKGVKLLVMYSILLGLSLIYLLYLIESM